MKETERVVAGGGPGRGGPMGGGMVGQKSLTFVPSAKRLAGRMRPDRAQGLRRPAARRRQRLAQRHRAAAPRPRDRPDLRRAVRASARRHHQGRRGRGAAGARRRQARRHARRHGRRAPARASTSPPSATCCCWCSRCTSRPPRSRGCRASCSTTWCRAPCAGCAATSRTKINRLPLSYFDRQPRGELLSRVTNDIDNVSQTLQQTMSQLLVSLLTVVGVIAMMFCISPRSP